MLRLSFSLLLFVPVFICTLSAQSFTEGEDLPGTGSGPEFTVSSPSITIAGTLNTPSDQQDRFQITIPSDCVVTGAVWSITDTANITVNGFTQFGINNQESIPPLSGSFVNGPFGLAFPVSAGTYECMMLANIAANDLWSMTFYTSCSTGITYMNFSQPLNVFPNPVADRIFFDNMNLTGTFTLTNSTGQIVITQPVSAAGVSVAEVAQGLYYYRIFSSGLEKHGKIVIVR